MFKISGPYIKWNQRYPTSEVHTDTFIHSMARKKYKEFHSMTCPYNVSRKSTISFKSNYRSRHGLTNAHTLRKQLSTLCYFPYLAVFTVPYTNVLPMKWHRL